jgi:hypothetical protein
MKFTEKEKRDALKQLQEEWDVFRPPLEIDERIFYHYCEGKDTEEILKAIQKDFSLLECYATKCWWYSTHKADLRDVAKRIGMNFNCGTCKEECIPERFRN